MFTARSRTPSPARRIKHLDGAAQKGGTKCGRRTRTPPPPREEAAPDPVPVSIPTAATAATAATTCAADRVTDVDSALALLAAGGAADPNSVALLRRVWRAFSPRLPDRAPAPKPPAS